MSRNYRIVVVASLLLLLNGCSYSPNVTQVPTEELATYNPKHFQNLYDKKVEIENEDSLIMQAIYYEQIGDFEKSNTFYSQLYDLTGNEEYLLREMGTALYVGKESKNVGKLKTWVQTHPDRIKAKRILLSYYLNEKEYEQAKVLAKELLEVSSEPIDYELAANPYILSHDYSEAIKLLDEAYKQTLNADILIKITTLYANYIGDIDSAIARLENHRQTQECNERICHQLLEIYTRQEKIQPLMEIYQELFEATKSEQYAIKIIEGYMYQKQIQNAIEFLENRYTNNELLYELYLSQKAYKKAEQTAQKLYQKGAGAKWLAESAMALYESYSDKNDPSMIQKILQRLDQAIREGAEEGVYLNYYGYTLIDHDIDVAKGIEQVQKALEREPDNSYYLDSLAWGYYKEKRCQEAYEVMKKVVDMEGLDEAEIVDHWTQIKACIKE